MKIKGDIRISRRLVVGDTTPTGSTNISGLAIDENGIVIKSQQTASFLVREAPDRNDPDPSKRPNHLLNSNKTLQESIDEALNVSNGFVSYLNYIGGPNALALKVNELLIFKYRRKSYVFKGDATAYGFQANASDFDFVLTSVEQHNYTTGLQGGAPLLNEYYHMSLEEYNFLKYLSDPANCFASWVQQFVAGNCQIGGNTFVAPTATFTLSPSSYVSTSPQNIILGINVTPNDGQAISWTVTSADNLFTYTTSDLGEIGTLVQLTDATLRTTVGFVYYTLTVEYLDTNADPFSFTLNKNMQITAPLAFAQVGAARSISSPSILSYSIIGRNNALGYVSDVPEMGLASVADEYRFSTTGDLLGEYVDNVRDNVTLLNRLNLTKSEMTAGFVLEAKANNGAASVQIVMLIPKSFGAPTKFVVAGFADDTRNWQYEDTGGNLQWNRVQDDDFYYYYHAIYQTAGSLFNYRLEF